jgi:hypothetical protein
MSSSLILRAVTTLGSVVAVAATVGAGTKWW